MLTVVAGTQPVHVSGSQGARRCFEQVPAKGEGSPTVHVSARASAGKSSSGESGSAVTES